MNMLSIIGDVTPPDYLTQGYGDNVEGGGLIKLISNLIKFIITVGGIWAFFNLILAGFAYIIHGDSPDELTKAHQRINMSLIGLALMVGSFVLAGILGWVFFKDASAILTPQIYGPTP